MLSSYFYVFSICASYFIYFCAVLANNVVLRIRDPVHFLPLIRDPGWVKK
jgi:hypothetical protein